jgi:hypothetical protein
MHKHRRQADGSLRDADNWQRGIPPVSYVSSLWRHFMDVWKWRRDVPAQEDIKTALCAMMFNTMGLLHEVLKMEDIGAIETSDSILDGSTLDVSQTHTIVSGLGPEDIHLEGWCRKCNTLATFSIDKNKGKAVCDNCPPY